MKQLIRLGAVANNVWTMNNSNQKLNLVAHFSIHSNGALTSFIVVFRILKIQIKQTNKKYNGFSSVKHLIGTAKSISLIHLSCDLRNGYIRSNVIRFRYAYDSRIFSFRFHLCLYLHRVHLIRILALAHQLSGWELSVFLRRENVRKKKKKSPLDKRRRRERRKNREISPKLSPE